MPSWAAISFAKGSVKRRRWGLFRSNHPLHLLTQGGEFELPSSDDEGLGAVGDTRGD